MMKPQGIIVPILTPFDAQENLNEQELRRQVNRMIQAGVSGIFPLGTNGEFYALGYEEKIQVLQIVMDENAGRVPIYAGVGCVTTKETLKLSRYAQSLGVDALSIISPYFTSASQDDIYRHFATVAQNVDLPIILYNIPARSGNNIDYTTIKKLADYPNVVGVKDSSGNFDTTLRYIENTDERLSVLAGSDSLILWTLSAGGTGAVSGCANVFPELMVDIYKYWEQGDFAKANEAQKSIRPFRNVMQMGNPNSVVKRAVELLGYAVGPAREPSNCTNDKIDQALIEVLKLYRK